MMKHPQFSPGALKIYLRKTAQKEGAGAARDGRARNSNPYPILQDAGRQERNCLGHLLRAP